MHQLPTSGSACKFPPAYLAYSYKEAFTEFLCGFLKDGNAKQSYLLIRLDPGGRRLKSRIRKGNAAAFIAEEAA